MYRESDFCWILCFFSDEHAYDPVVELETQQEYRDSVQIEDNKIIFSVIDYRKDSESVHLIDSDSEICKENGLKNVEFIFDTESETADKKQGCTAYEVFYEADISTDDVWSAVDALAADENIVSAEPDFIWNDTSVGLAAEVSEAEIANESHFDLLDVADVWKNLSSGNVTPGKGVVGAVIDTGVDYTHKDLAANMWTNSEEIPDDGNGYIDDVYGYDFVSNDGDPMDDMGHGTHVTGIIAMTPGNGGGVGLAYGAKIMAVKAGQSNGSFASSDIAKAIKYAYDNGADVINMSFGGTGKSNLVEAALQDAFSSCVLVASAGNDGLPTTDAIEGGFVKYEDIYPAGYNYVI